ncbi:MAG: MarR family transcriptional regulator [Spirochaetales bacterium]|nr:MarR family transcriptional regulator [Spirochaetales bacterium]
MSFSQNECILHQMERCEKLLRRYYAERLHPLGLSPTEYRVCATLAKAGGVLPPRELAAILSVTRPATSTLVARMEKKDLVQRHFAEGSRKEIRIRLTKEGHVKAEKGSTTLNEADAQLKKITNKGIVRFSEELRALEAVLGKEE